MPPGTIASLYYDRGDLVPPGTIASLYTRAMLKHSKASERMFCGVANH